MKKNLPKKAHQMIGQMNIAVALDALDSPKLAEFMENLDRINALAEASPGFIWRLKDDSGNATAIPILQDPKAVLNVSVWQSVDDLYAFSFQTDHQAFVKRRREWFQPSKKITMALWSLEDSKTMPTVDEAFARLTHLQVNGPSSFAFNWATAKRFAC